MKNNRNSHLKIRQTRIRAKLKRLGNRLRLSVFRSNEHIYGQIIDDEKGKTLVTACDQELSDKEKKVTKIEIAKEVGKLLAVKAKKNKISKVYFDRSGLKYHGRIKALAEGTREGGLVF